MHSPTKTSTTFTARQIAARFSGHDCIGRPIRRGSMYAVVLGCSAIVACLAIASLHTVRLHGKLNVQAQDWLQARDFAESGLAYWQQQQQQRSPSDPAYTLEELSQLDDQGDGFRIVARSSPLGNNLDGVTEVEAVGISGEAVQRLSARFEARPTLYPGLRGALVSLDDIDLVGCHATSNHWAICSDKITFTDNVNYAYMAMNALARKGYTNGSYRVNGRQLTGGQWPSSLPSFNPAEATYPGKYYESQGIVIPGDSLPLGGAEMLSNPGLESGVVTPWSLSGTPGSLTMASITKYQGSWSGLVTGRSASSVVPQQNVTAQILKGRPYQCSVWIRPTNQMTVSIGFRIRRVGFGGWLSQNSSGVTCDANKWTRVSGTITPTWDAPLDRADLVINTSNASSFHFDSVSMIDNSRSAGVRYLERCILSETINPYGAQQPSPLGIYVLDCPNEELVIRDCRLQASLYVRSTKKVWLNGSILWQPPGLNYPALIANGEIEENFDPHGIDEFTLGFPINPPTCPLYGQSDADIGDWGYNELDGLFFGAKKVILRGREYFDAPIFAGDDIEARRTYLSIYFPSDLISNPPPGFYPPPTVKQLVPSSVRESIAP
jgi:hypothetical protein